MMCERVCTADDARNDQYTKRQVMNVNEMVNLPRRRELLGWRSRCVANFAHGVGFDLDLLSSSHTQVGISNEKIIYTSTHFSDIKASSLQLDCSAAPRLGVFLCLFLAIAWNGICYGFGG
eukprot:scaffold30089_cov167-Skeletonema_dohrnii-CCMP3373.AAC.1